MEIPQDEIDAPAVTPLRLGIHNGDDVSHHRIRPGIQNRPLPRGVDGPLPSAAHQVHAIVDEMESVQICLRLHARGEQRLIDRQNQFLAQSVPSLSGMGSLGARASNASE